VRGKPAGRVTGASPEKAPAASRELLQQYIRHLTHERRLSEHTAIGYRRDIEALLVCAGETPLGDLKIHDIRRFVGQLHGRGLSPRSLARMLSGWRGFYRYLARDHGYRDNPCVGMRAPKAPRRLPNALSPDEARRLLETKPADAMLAMRDKAMFELLYSSGLRLAELIRLAPTDVNYDDATVRVTGKGSKTRIVPVGSHAIAALEAWLEARAQIRAIQSDALFVNRAGRRLTSRSVQLRLKAWALKRGVPTRVHPHVLRHSFASHVLQSSGDLRAVQEMLGHASISSTQVYTHLDFQHLAKVYDAAHPRARTKANAEKLQHEGHKGHKGKRRDRTV
jgi:integrase/recombinase XerC